MKTIILQNEARRSHAMKVIGSLPLDELWAVSIEPYKKQRSSEGQSEMIRSSTTKLTTKEFAEFAEKVERWGIETPQVWLDQ